MSETLATTTVERQETAQPEFQQSILEEPVPDVNSQLVIPLEEPPTDSDELLEISVPTFITTEEEPSLLFSSATAADDVAALEVAEGDDEHGVETSEDRFDSSDSGLGSESAEEPAQMPPMGVDPHSHAEQEVLGEEEELPSPALAVLPSTIESNTVFEMLKRQPTKSSLKRKRVDDVMTAAAAPPCKRQRRIAFDSITVFYFPRTQGFTCIPSQGGSTLGMQQHHSHMRTFSLGEHANEQRRLHRQLVQQLTAAATVAPSPTPPPPPPPVMLPSNTDNNSLVVVVVDEDDDENSEENENVDADNNEDDEDGEAVDEEDDEDDDDEEDDEEEEEEDSDIPSDAELDDLDQYYFVQPVPTRQRRALLKAAGVRKIDTHEKDECRTIRSSREYCGCTCKVYCDADTCTCAQAGIKCQVDRLNFPCGCTRDHCANPSGRIEFNPMRVRTHFIHTLMRLDLEKKSAASAPAAASASVTVTDHHQQQMACTTIAPEQFVNSVDDELLSTLVAMRPDTTTAAPPPLDLYTFREEDTDGAVDYNLYNAPAHNSQQQYIVLDSRSSGGDCTGIENVVYSHSSSSSYYTSTSDCQTVMSDVSCAQAPVLDCESISTSSCSTVMDSGNLGDIIKKSIVDDMVAST